MATGRAIATSASIALTNAYTRTAVAVPSKADLSLVSVEMTSISGAASVTWYLSRDSAGDQPITPLWTDTILDAGSGSGAGSVVRDMAGALNHAGGSLYVNAKLDAGTATGVARVGYRAGP